MNVAQYEKFIKLYKGHKDSTRKTICSRINRLFGIMSQSVYLSKYTIDARADSGGTFDLCAITIDDVSRLFTLINTSSTESKKQLALTFKMLLGIYGCGALLSTSRFAEHMDFMISEANNSREISSAARASSIKKQWADIINIAGERLSAPQGDNGVDAMTHILCAFIVHLPPLRPQEYIVMQRKHIDSSGVLKITEHKAKTQFAAKYGNDGSRTIKLPKRLLDEINASTIKGKHILSRYGSALTDSVLRRLVMRIFGHTLSDLRLLYISDVVKKATAKRAEELLYIMGKTTL